MEEKRYQVFISSTFEDLREERRAVQDVVVSTGDFPVQMESFPAADEDQFEFIKSLINQCDYYVLIIAGRYGSLGTDGLSYTHKEFRYAVSRNVPVLVMLYADLGQLSVAKSETKPEGVASLAAFIKEAETGRLRKTWNTIDGLKLAVREALDNAKATKPRPGWVRGDTLTSLEALEELNEVRKENESFRRTLGSLAIKLDLPPIPPPSARLVINLLPNSNKISKRRGAGVSIATTWIDAFPIVHSNLSWQQNSYSDQAYYYDEEESCIDIGSALAGAAAPIDTGGCFKIGKDTLKRLMNYYIEAGLMLPQGADVPFTEIAEKIARRQSIAEPNGAAFDVVQGKIVVGLLDDYSRDLDDDIPF